MVSLSVDKNIVITMDDGTKYTVLEADIPPPGDDQERADILNGKLDEVSCPPDVRITVQGEALGVRVMWGEQPGKGEPPSPE